VKKPRSSPTEAASIAQSQRNLATITPSLARALLVVVKARGHSPQRQCRGLGFSYADLYDANLRLSYQQTWRLILRAQALLDDPALGLATGACQTPVSWGLPGLAMLTCETYGEAVAYGIARQNDLGALLDVEFEMDRGEMSFAVMPRYFDPDIQVFLVQEAFASVLSVSRYMVGPEFAPRRVEFVSRDNRAKEQCARYFRCPVRFGATGNRMVFDSRWLTQRLPGHDPIISDIVRAQLETLMSSSTGRDDLVESLSQQLRARADKRPSLPELALQANLSERTLRRRLGAQSMTYRQLRDRVLYETACDLLANPALTIVDVAVALGYSDAQAFRRAFKRWSGRLPTAFRKVV